MFSFLNNSKADSKSFYDLSINSIDGDEIKFSNFKEKSILLVNVASNCGFTKQYEDLQKLYELYKSNGFIVLGGSPDSSKSHQKFIDKYNLPFSLIADEDKTVIKAFGVWGPKKFMGKEYDGVHRTTFVIDEEGVIEKVFSKV